MNESFDYHNTIKSKNIQNKIIINDNQTLQNKNMNINPGKVPSQKINQHIDVKEQNISSNNIDPIPIKNDNNIQTLLLAKSKTNLANEFRIPSSRNFCGRLLSSHQSTTSTDTSRCSTSSSGSSVSETINKLKDISDEEFDELTVQALRNEKFSEKKKGSESPIDSISTSSPSTNTSTSNSPSPVTDLKIQNIKNSPKNNGTKFSKDSLLSVDKELNWVNQTVDTNHLFSIKNINVKNNSINELSLSNNNILSSKHSNNEKTSQLFNSHQIMKKSNTLNFPEKNLQNINYDNIDNSGQQNKYQSNRELNLNLKDNISNKSQALAKSVEHLLDKSLINNSGNKKKQLLVKQIDLDSQKEINTILAVNSRQMALSNSIKDLRLFVSNSYSPSQIVKPPQSNISGSNLNNIQVKSNKNYTRKAQDDQQKQFSTILNYENAITINKNNNNGKEKLLPQTKLDLYTNTMLKPLKDERSDQIRLEYFKQQALISKLQKQQLKEHLNKETPNNNNRLNNQEKSFSNNSYKNPLVNNHYEELNRDKRDDELINCILGMKPMSSSNKDQLSQNVSNIFNDNKQDINQIKISSNKNNCNNINNRDSTFITNNKSNKVCCSFLINFLDKSF